MHDTNDDDDDNVVGAGAYNTPEASDRKYGKFILPIQFRYVPEWNGLDGLREFLTNWQDGKARHSQHEGSMSFTKSTKGEWVLKLRNPGVYVTRDKLTFGGTDKQGRDDQIGHFGEGMKLGFMCVLRAGWTVRVVNHDEIWKIVMEHSREFGTEVLAIHISRRQTGPAGFFEVQVSGLPEMALDELKKRSLALAPPPPEEVLTVPAGEILLSDRHKGFLYVHGILICALPEPSSFGYNLNGVKLDRSRRLADPWDLKYEVRQALDAALLRNLLPGPRIFDILASDMVSMESLALQDMFCKGSVTAALRAEWEARYGGLIPVGNMKDSIAATGLGIKSRTTSPVLAKLLGIEGLDLKIQAKEARLQAKRLWGFEELSTVDQASVLWALRVIEPLGLDLGKFQVVDFPDEAVQGTYNSGTGVIRIAQRVLQDRELLGVVLVHEIAHRAGADGSTEHLQEIQAIAGKLLAHFVV